MECKDVILNEESQSRALPDPSMQNSRSNKLLTEKQINGFHKMVGKEMEMNMNEYTHYPCTNHVCRY